MNFLPRLFPPRNRQVASARRAAADEHRVVLVRQQCLQTLHALPELQLHPQVGDVGDLLVDHAVRQAEFWDLAADHATGAGIDVE